MRSKISIAGHPIHPQIIPFPIAFSLGALLSDMIYLRQRTDTWYNISLFNLVLGSIGGAAAAAPGAIDYFTSLTVGSHNQASTHALLNGSFIALNSANASMRMNGKAKQGRNLVTAVMLSLLGACLLGISGWLGGELVYKHGIAVEPAPPHKHKYGDPREPWEEVA
jgi:uncharacterized membrane protein